MRILVNIALFLLPFAAFFLYARYANARRASAGHDPLETPWFWLAAAALSLAIAGFFVMASVALGYFVNPWFFAFTAFVGLNLFQSAFTKWCPMITFLRKLKVREG